MCTHTTIGNHASMMHGANQKQTNCVRADLIETTTKKLSKNRLCNSKNFSITMLN